jgi:hypothetical protein
MHLKSVTNDKIIRRSFQITGAHIPDEIFRASILRHQLPMRKLLLENSNY